MHPKVDPCRSDPPKHPGGNDDQYWIRKDQKTAKASWWKEGSKESNVTKILDPAYYPNYHPEHQQEETCNNESTKTLALSEMYHIC